MSTIATFLSMLLVLLEVGYASDLMSQDGLPGRRQGGGTRLATTLLHRS